MSDAIEFDSSEILQLAADIERVPRAASRNVRKAIEVTARKVKDDWREPLKGSPTIPGGDRTISYDIKGGEGVRSDAIEAEIGPTVEGKGSHWPGGLVGALEYGIPGKAGPTGFGAAALKKNQADFEQGLSIALADAEKEAGIS